MPTIADPLIASDPEAPVGPALSTASPATAPIGRYQIAAFGSSTNNYGYYVVDTTTGRVWYGMQGSPPRLVAQSLPER